MPEPRDIRLRRLTMRSMRRGIREMDIILTRFAGAQLGGFSEAQLDTYDALLEENDHDLYQWVSGQVQAPERYRTLIADIAHAPDASPDQTAPAQK